MKTKFVVETVNTFYEVHLVEAENEEEAEDMVRRGYVDYYDSNEFDLENDRCEATEIEEEE